MTRPRSTTSLFGARAATTAPHKNAKLDVRNNTRRPKRGCRNPLAKEHTAALATVALTRPEVQIKRHPKSMAPPFTAHIRYIPWAYEIAVYSL